MKEDDTTMRRQIMSLDRFRALVAAFGDDGDRWPEADRDAAEALAVRSPEARAIREAAARLDRILCGLSPPPPSAALRERLMRLGPHGDGAAQHSVHERTKLAGLGWLLGPLAVGGAAAAVVAATLWFGVGPIPGHAPVEPVSEAVATGGIVEPPLLEGVALVDGNVGGGFDEFSNTDLGTDSLAGPSGGGLAGLALE